MEKGIKIFSNPEFGQLRTQSDEHGELLFCASDICDSLGYSNARKAIADHVDKGDVTKRDTPTTSGVQSMTFVNESGLYALIFGSKLESAKSFKRWVTGEVLPSIRRDGGYIGSRDGESAEEIMAKAVLLAQKTIERRNERIAELERECSQRKELAEEQGHLLKMREKEIEEQRPKVAFCDAIVSSKSSCLIGELAKILTQNGYKIGQNRLFEWMREHEYLGKAGERYNIPNQQWMEMGLFEVKKTVHDQNGVLVTKSTPKVTGKGQKYFINKFLGNRND